MGSRQVDRYFLGLAMSAIKMNSHYEGHNTLGHTKRATTTYVRPLLHESIHREGHYYMGPHHTARATSLGPQVCRATPLGPPLCEVTSLRPQLCETMPRGPQLFWATLPGPLLLGDHIGRAKNFRAPLLDCL